MKGLRQVIGACVVGVIAGGSAEAAGKADRIFLNGRVWTGNAARPWAEALAVRGPNIVAVGTTAEINPERTWRIIDGLPTPFIEGAIPWKPRQLLTPAYQLNGAVYAFRLDRFPAQTPSVLFGRIGAEQVDADEVIDIDNEKDFVIANAILQSRNIAHPGRAMVA